MLDDNNFRMKQKLFFLQGIILALVVTVAFSCTNNEHDYTDLRISKPNESLIKYASLHNLGLEYIINDAKGVSGNFTKENFKVALEKYVIGVYGKEKSKDIIYEISSMEDFVLSGNIPSLNQTRSAVSDTNALAVEAANVCLDKISVHLNNFRNNEILDNNHLLDEMHVIIDKTYNEYSKKCSSDNEMLALNQALGVLYGSVEYWVNSKNVSEWAELKLEDDSNSSPSSSLENKSKDGKDNKKDDKNKKEDKKKVSVKEFVTIMAAADTLGAFLGAGIASSPAAIAASAAAALYYEVEE